MKDKRKQNSQFRDHTKKSYITHLNTHSIYSKEQKRIQPTCLCCSVIKDPVKSRRTLSIPLKETFPLQSKS